MSEGNGISPESWRERFDRLEKSHVQLMTDHEMFVREHDAFRQEQDAEWARQKERWAQHDKWQAGADQRWTEQGERIERLVSGIGELIRKMDDRNYLALVSRVEALEKKLGAGNGSTD